MRRAHLFIALTMFVFAITHMVFGFYEGEDAHFLVSICASLAGYANLVAAAKWRR